ncbi:MAG: L-threonylcarbamoyladenylate synthase [bacterium]
MIINSEDVVADLNKCKGIVNVLSKGGIMIYPTETVYGIGCDAFNDSAINRIVSLKQRLPDKPLIVLVKDIHMLIELVVELPSIGVSLINKFWPGPLTLIFNAKPHINKQLTAGTGKIAVRQSPHPFIRSVFELYSHPIVSTSANISNMPPAVSISEIPTSITDNVDLIIDGGKLNNIPSTVIDITDNRIELIREGAIKKSLIERLFL